jgi:mannose-1-phosphate guanylyltransferase
VLINTHWLADHVRGYVASCRWRPRIDLVHEGTLLGTGGTILANRGYFGRDAVLVAHADNLTEFDVGAFERAHRDRPATCALTMLAFRTDNPSSCGVLELGKGEIVVSFHEKVPYPPGNLANAAVYLIEPEVIEFIAGLGKPCVDFSTEVIPAFIGRILALETTGYHRDIGTLDSLMLARREFKPRATRCG